MSIQVLEEAKKVPHRPADSVQCSTKDCIDSPTLDVVKQPEEFLAPDRILPGHPLQDVTLCFHPFFFAGFYLVLDMCLLPFLLVLQ